MVSQLAVATAAFLVLSAPVPAAAADIGAQQVLPLTTSIDQLAPASESREGYQRTSFRHWVDADRDGCSTRAEVLIAESEWRSYGTVNLCGCWGS
jgi:hypothetical protein